VKSIKYPTIDVVTQVSTLYFLCLANRGDKNERFKKKCFVLSTLYSRSLVEEQSGCVRLCIQVEEDKEEENTPTKQTYQFCSMAEVQDTQ